MKERGDGRRGEERGIVRDGWENRFEQIKKIESEIRDNEGRVGELTAAKAKPGLFANVLLT